MFETVETPREITTVFDGIESQLDRSLAVQKDAIEKGLTEKLNREKEEAQKRIEAAEREFAEEKKALDSYRATLAELKSAREQIQGQIKGHIDRAQSCQQMMEKMSSQALEEYEKVSHLGLEVDGVRQRAERELSLLRKHLEEKYGIRSELEAAFEPAESLTNLRHEIAKMKKVRELLASGLAAPAEEAPAPDPAPAAAPAAAPAPPVERAYERPAMQGRPVDRFIDLPEPVEAAPEPAPVAEDPEPTAKFDVTEDLEAEEQRMLVDRLALYRRTEPVLNGTEFAYFSTGKKMVLDGEAFMATVAKISEVARGLHVNLGQKEMSKDLFLIKQEILNQQEVLRKAFLRVVRFCEKEDGTLPQFAADVLNVRVMKDILERLTFGNWSNPADFNAFIEHIARLRAAFKEKLTVSRDYLISVLEQLEGTPIVNN